LGAESSCKSYTIFPTEFIKIIFAYSLTLEHNISKYSTTYLVGKFFYFVFFFLSFCVNYEFQQTNARVFFFSCFFIKSFFSHAKFLRLQ